MRQCICKNCGKIYLTDKRESWYCPQCAKELKSDVSRKKVCARCGVEFVGYPRSKYCENCAPIVSRERTKHYHQNGPARPIGSVDLCERCGKEYTVNSGMQKYCPDCAKIAVRETLNAQARKWKQLHLEEVKQKRQEMKKDRRVCVICGKPFSSPTPTVTCSPECEAENRRRRQAKADRKRNRPMSERCGASGVQCVIADKRSGKWALRIKRKHYGLFNTVEEAAKEKEKILRKQAETEKECNSHGH